MIVQNVGRLRIRDGVYADLWSCTLAFPDDASDMFWINTGQTARTMSGVIFSGAVVDQGLNRHPDIESVVQMLCQDAVNVENSSNRLDVYVSDFLKCGEPLDQEELESHASHYRQMQRNTEQLRDFLGGKYDSYLHKTVWTR
ncbi:hypothetical protein [Streptomyces sp. NPDC017448]|uniref:hypothetical protein n=1 Tax=Streptomyces sp. NPDC017448 TaxID=3364996 RepID=UPI003794EDBE